MVLRLGLIVDAPLHSRLVVAHEGDCYSLIESSVVHLLFVGASRTRLRRKASSASVFP
jgi:hypothetical protein